MSSTFNGPPDTTKGTCPAEVPPVIKQSEVASDEKFLVKQQEGASINKSEKKEAPKSPFGAQDGGITESEKFPGTKIISFQNGGKLKHYALSRDSSGNLQGSEFELQEYSIQAGTGGEGFWKNSTDSLRADESKHRIGPTYQMNGGAVDAMEEYLKEKGISI